jgi:signal transduction histidine kinase
MARNSRSKPEGDKLPNAAWTRDEFLAVISHEIRNSTQIIISWAELMGRQLDSSEAISGGLEVIRHNGRLQAKLLNQLLAFSGKRRGSLARNASRISLAPILESAAKTMSPQALAKRIQLCSELEPPICLVIGDASELEEVFTNLLSNAIKFTPAGGRIDVRLSCSKDRAEITVTDTGRGISPEFLPHVFDRFRQEIRSSASRDGLGLGLAITKYLVERHHGQIEVFSAGEGRGSTFQVSLPLASPAVAEDRPLRPARLRSRTRCQTDALGEVLR